MSNCVNIVINLGVYPFDLMVSFGESDKKLLKRLIKLGIKEEEFQGSDGKDYTGNYRMFENGQSLIRLPKIPSTPFEYGVLSHEILHCVFTVMDSVGMKYSYKSEEAYTYFQGYITEKILCGINT